MGTTEKNSLNGAKNIGTTILKRLNNIGFYTFADLAEMTPAKAYKNMSENNPEKTLPICYYLYSLQGALLDIHWNNLPQDLKSDLLKQVGRE